MAVEKLIHKGLVGVLVSPGFGAGWTTWMDDEFREELLYNPTLIRMVEQGDNVEITQELCQHLLGVGEDTYLCVLGRDQLTVEWIPEGAEFILEEYDGAEYLTLKKDINFHKA